VPAYTIKGECDDVCDKLKSTLEQQEAGFRASLNAMFKPAKPAQKPASTAVAQKTAPRTGMLPSGGPVNLTRKGDDSQMRSRLRGSLRITV
jgi:hypothetical protein